MKDGFDVSEDVKSLINVPAVTNKLTGDIYTFMRPNDSKKSDIVIGLLACDNLWTQTALVNVRIYVPNLTLNLNGVLGQYPDQSKFDAISKTVTKLLDGQYKSSFWTEVEEDNGLIRQPDGTYFQLIKVIYKSIQDNYKNI